MCFYRSGQDDHDHHKTGGWWLRPVIEAMTDITMMVIKMAKVDKKVKRVMVIKTMMIRMITTLVAGGRGG